FRREKTGLRIGELLQAFSLAPGFHRYAALIGQIKSAIAHQDAIGGSKSVLIRRQNNRVIRLVGHQDEPLLLQLARGNEKEADDDWDNRDSLHDRFIQV